MLSHKERASFWTFYLFRLKLPSRSRKRKLTLIPSWRTKRSSRAMISSRRATGRTQWSTTPRPWRGTPRTPRSTPTAPRATPSSTPSTWWSRTVTRASRWTPASSRPTSGKPMCWRPWDKLRRRWMFTQKPWNWIPTLTRLRTDTRTAPSGSIKGIEEATPRR